MFLCFFNAYIHINLNFFGSCIHSYIHAVKVCYMYIRMCVVAIIFSEV